MSLSPVKSLHTFVILQGHRRRGILVGHNLDVCTSAALRSDLKGLIEFSARAYTRGKPVVASKRLGQVGVVPLSKIVVLDVGILAEQPLYQVTRIVKDEDDGLQPASAELTDLLSRQLMGAFTCNQHNATVGRRDCCSKGRRGRISDSAPQRLVVKLRALRQECQSHSKPGSPSLGDDDIVRFNKIRPARIERVCGNRIAAHAFYWSERTWSNRWFLISLLDTSHELSEDIFHFDVGINLCAHMSTMVTDIDGLFGLKMRCEGARAEVRQNRSDQNDGVA